MIPFANATVAISRRTTTNGVSSLAPVSGLGAVPVYLRDLRSTLEEQGVTPEFDLTVTFDGAWDIRDGDQLTLVTYHGDLAAETPLYQIQHVSPRDGPFNASKTATVRVLTRP